MCIDEEYYSWMLLVVVLFNKPTSIQEIVYLRPKTKWLRSKQLKLDEDFEEDISAIVLGVGHDW